MKKTILKIYGWVLLLGLAYYIWVSVTQIKIPCMIYLTTGLECPGCGMTRMCLSLARLEIGKAFSYNPVMFLVLIFWNVVAIFCFIGKPAFVQKKKFLYTALWISIGIGYIWGILRNII